MMILIYIKVQNCIWKVSIDYFNKIIWILSHAWFLAKLTNYAWKSEENAQIWRNANKDMHYALVSLQSLYIDWWELKKSIFWAWFARPIKAVCFNDENHLQKEKPGEITTKSKQICHFVSCRLNFLASVLYNKCLTNRYIII